jgi:hypothetical protein
MGHHFEVLDRDGEAYHLAPEMDCLLARPDDLYFLDGFPRVHLSVSRDYARYPELVRLVRFGAAGVLHFLRLLSSIPRRGNPG